jgi:hypothetical protein
MKRKLSSLQRDMMMVTHLRMLWIKDKGVEAEFKEEQNHASELVEITEVVRKEEHGEAQAGQCV